MEREEVRDVVRKNYRMLEELYLEEIEDTSYGFLAWSSTDYGDTNIFWNHAVITGRVDSADPELERIEKFYRDKGRVPALYIPEIGETGIRNQLGSRGFEKAFTDAWMFYSGSSPEIREDVEIRKVDSVEDMQRFVELFYRSHAPDLDDPYAGLSKAYGEQLEKSFKGSRGSVVVKNFLALVGDEEVGHVTSIRYGGVAALFNLGTVPEKRGKGIGSGVLRRGVEKLRENGVEKIFLQTEKGSGNEDFFEKNGFSTEFVADGFSKEE